MTQFLLAGISHAGDGDGFMDPPSKEAFRRRVVPLLTENSVVLSEGYFVSGLVRPGSEEYGVFVRITGIGDAVQRPLFAAVDPRFTRDKKKTATRGRIDDEWSNFVALHMRVFTARPTTTQEAIELIHADSVVCKTTATPTSADLQNARHVLSKSGRFDRTYRDAMRRLDGRCDICVCLTGAMHTIMLAKETGYPVERLWEEGTVTPDELIHTYVEMYAGPRLVLGAS